jgi:sugar-specific transcriptional regulator TrmB
MSDEIYQKVFNTLVQNRSMAFLELSAVTRLDEPQLRHILDDLEKKGLVRITDKDDTFKQIITVRDRAFTASPSYGD